MKFGIDMGHNCPPHDTGASGWEQEDKLTRSVGNLPPVPPSLFK